MVFQPLATNLVHRSLQITIFTAIKRFERVTRNICCYSHVNFQQPLMHLVIFLSYFHERENVAYKNLVERTFIFTDFGTTFMFLILKINSLLIVPNDVEK